MRLYSPTLVPGNGFGGVLRGKLRVALAVFLGFRAYFHQAGGGGLDPPPPINGDHTPGEVSAAYVLAAPAVLLWGLLDATLIARPLPMAAVAA